MGDAAFVAKAQARVKEFVATSRILVLATHSQPIMREWCNKAIFLSGGELRAFGEVNEVLDQYLKVVGPRPAQGPNCARHRSRAMLTSQSRAPWILAEKRA